MIKFNTVGLFLEGKYFITLQVDSVHMKSQFVVRSPRGISLRVDSVQVESQSKLTLPLLTLCAMDKISQRRVNLQTKLILTLSRGQSIYIYINHK
jgi:hypothetical protein